MKKISIRSAANRRRLALFTLIAFLLTIFVQPNLFQTPVSASDKAAESVLISPNVVISQIYGGNGNTFASDYVELFNRGGSPASLAGYTIQYASATGTGNFAVAATLTGTIAPGQYYLVRLATAATGTATPTPDATGTTNISGTAGKVIVANSTAALACNGGSTACSAAQQALIIDLVGYGGANFFEGTAPAPAASTTTAVFRAGNGCTDTDQNSTDFTAAAPAPRNTATALSPCGGGTPTVSINDVVQNEGNAGTSTFAFTVTLSPAAAGNVTFDIATADGTATVANNDYVANNASVTIPAGTTAYTFNVTVNGDTVTEPNETFFVNITNLLGAAAGDLQGQGTITNDDFTVTPISQIQGSGSLSPFAGSTVTANGIVTAIVSSGFFMQTPDAQADADPNTSEGIFVFTAGAPPASAAIGNSVAVSGTLSEFRPSTDPNSPPVTEITFATVTLLSTGNPLPSPVVITAAATTAASGTTNPLDSLEEYEGMRVQVNSLRVVAPTGGFVNEANATSTSDGVFQGVVTGVARPVREVGLQVSNPLPSGTTAMNVPRFDENPEKIRVDSDRQIGAAAINVTTDATVANLVGVLDFAFRTYTLLPDAAAPPTVSGNASAIAVPAPLATEMIVASFNLERFFDTVNDGNGAPTLTATAFNNRLNKASLAIRNVLRTPDILGVIEVENLSTLQALATKINNDAVANGDPNPQYQGYLSEGNDVGGIDVGFLVKSARVNVIDVTQVGKTATFTNPDNSTSTLNDRPPLVLRATAQYTTNMPVAVTVIVNHLRSLNGIDDETAGTNGFPTGGARVRFKRRAQAEYLANLIQARQTADPTERIFAVGDFNAFQISDGYADLIGTIKGTPAPADQVVLASSDLVNPNLTNLADALPQPSFATNERYSYVFDGNAQILDHVLVNPSALANVTRFHYARLDADFPETFRSDPNRPERISDHDAAVSYVSLTVPNAANAELGGRVTTGRKRGVSGVTISLIDGNTGAIRTTRTSSLGYYRFAEVQTGTSYIVQPSAGKYIFLPGNQLVSFTETQETVDFEAQRP